MTNRFAVTNAIMAELDRQDARWGKDRTLPAPLWLLVLTEELGEVAAHCDENPPDTAAAIVEARAEVVQLAAVGHQMIAAIDDGRVPWDDSRGVFNRADVAFAELVFLVGQAARGLLNLDDRLTIDSLEAIEDWAQNARRELDDGTLRPREVADDRDEATVKAEEGRRRADNAEPDVQAPV